MIIKERKNNDNQNNIGESFLSKIKSFISKHPIIFYGMIGGIIILLVLIIILCVVLTKKDKEEENNKIEENNEVEEIKIFPLEESSKNDVMNIYNNIGNKDKSTLEIFCDYLNETASNLKEEQKVYLSYYWIINNIDFDSYASNDPKIFFQNKKCVSYGFTYLFRNLLICMKYPNSKIKDIFGYAKGQGYSPFITSMAPNHFWNAVEINGKWCLIDTAWDANTISEYYLCTPPKCLVRNHLPQNDDSLQFLENPLTFEKFHNLIFESYSFCEYGIEVIEDKAIQNICGEGKVILKYNSKYNNSDMHFIIIQNKEKLPEYFVNRIENGFEILLSINEKGVYDIHLSMNGYGLGEITFNCDEDPITKKYFPTQKAFYSFSDTQLISPIQRDLIQGQRYNFELRTSDYKEITIIIGDEYINMTKSGNTFKEENVYIHADTIEIIGNKSYELVTFKGIGNTVDYPKIYSNARNLNVRLIQPSIGTLSKGQTYEFQIKYNNVGKFFISLGTERIEMDKTNNIYKKTLKIEASITATKLLLIYQNIEPIYSRSLYEYILN